eukprot:scaffold9993_cov101-Isochrysis_galbana.AAC.3
MSKDWPAVSPSGTTTCIRPEGVCTLSGWPPLTPCGTCTRIFVIAGWTTGWATGSPTTGYMDISRKLRITRRVECSWGATDSLGWPEQPQRAAITLLPGRRGRLIHPEHLFRARPTKKKLVKP